ncbi:GAF and ANTAR domain-containing protein [Rhodococcus sp. BGS-1C]|uniref:GAF and ANTAR domain-containing protein n=1 Tax=unclassified Rhodococcus (in: high G+C Gram-positive bacteria) TaxID=192944 RepID=UPI0019D09DAB|nr:MULTISPECIES: GAF and ANTAR domain-containing protein [unclassified Rhodococcus (in: high G+C Gram-positive bacteria)]MCC8928030.1 GAF and ANTAR domain-containing protein [Rhodococcus sp. I2R]
MPVFRGGTAVTAESRLREDLASAMASGGQGLSAADRLCVACVDLLPVDGAAISVIHDGETRGTFGSSGEFSRRLDEFQFTFGEGPCLDAVATGAPVLVPDLADPGERRWPAFTPAVLDEGVQAVFALPTAIAAVHVGVLDLYRASPGPLSETVLNAGMWAAELAALPLLDLMTSDLDWNAASEGGDGWEQLASLERVEVYQATGMIIGQLDIGPVEALARLRAHAYLAGQTASEVAWDIVERRLVLTPDDHPAAGNNLGSIG